jgi:2-methylcitrate dehydratase PrpD
MPHDTDVTQRLAQFVAATKWDALKPPVVHETKRALMNFFAVALTGCREPAIETALRSLAAFPAAGRRR